MSGALRRRPRGIADEDLALVYAAALPAARTHQGEELPEVAPAHRLEVVPAEAAAFTAAEQEQAEGLAFEVAQQQPGPAVPIKDAEDAGRTNAAQLDSLAADGDVQHVVAAARARCSLQRLRVTDAEDAHGAVVA